MKIQVTFELDEDDENADPEHEMGVTNDAFDRLHRCVSELGGDDMDVERVE
jgi:hypothetical protein